MADAQHLPQGRRRAGDRHLKFYETRDNLLLITRLSGSIEYVGNAAVVRGLDGRRIQYPDRLFVCRLHDPSEAEFLELAFAGPEIRGQIEHASRSAAGHQRISIRDIRGFTFMRPPVEERKEIVARATALLSLADELTERIDRASKAVERSAQAVLAKALRGELLGSPSAEGR